MKVSEAMTRKVTLCSPNDSICNAAQAMTDCNSGLLPVGEGDRLIGMITDRDIAVRGVAQGPETLVRELMTNDVVCARPDDEIEDVANRMSEAQIRRLPVIDAQDMLCGIVSLGDLSREADKDCAQEALLGVSQPGGEHRQ
jgi:CBS domain-containing protein